MMLSEFHALEFIIDDSGSMLCNTDSNDPVTHKPISRWKEAQLRVKEMIDILAYVPFPQIVVEFLNRRDRVILTRHGRAPAIFIHDANSKIDAVFSRGPAGTTPALEKLQESLIKGQGMSIARYFFGDGIPNGGEWAQKEIVNILMNRQDPEGNPITFISCTDENDQVEWMKDAEEIVPYCSESDDFKEEGLEVLRDQGVALPYTKGFHLICTLVAAMNPDDLDAMDESVPFTKNTLDNLLGIQHPEESYKYYFDCFVQAQRERKVEGPSDQLKKNVQWNYNDFLHAPMAKDIPQVQQIKQQLLVSSLPPAIIPSSTPSLVSPGDDMVTTTSVKRTDGGISSTSTSLLSPDDAVVTKALGECTDGQISSPSPSLHSPDYAVNTTASSQSMMDVNFYGYSAKKWANGDEYIGEWKGGRKNGQGTLKYADGGAYAGEHQNDKRHGHGTYNFTDGAVYVGEWKDDKRHGHGTHNYADGGVYAGEHHNDKRHGHGTYNFTDGSVYVGEWKDNKGHGHGTNNYADGGVYAGEHQNGKRHGHGTNYYADGGVYAGEHQNDKRHGHGTSNFPDGSVHVGEYNDGKAHGHGNYKDANGDEYVGEWKNHRQHGHGTMKFANGKVYFGEWIDSKAHGHGTCKWADGGMYIGEWKDWKFHGQGTHKWANGGEFVGEFEDGNRHGQGSYKWANGCVYFGEWKDGKRHGQGTYKYPDGHEFSRDDILPSSEVVEPKCDLSENDQVCSICLDEFCRREERVVLPCSHGFHTCCANRWLSSESSCPVCRTPVPQSSVSVTLTPFQMQMFLHALVLNELNSDSD